MGFAATVCEVMSRVCGAEFFGGFGVNYRSLHTEIAEKITRVFDRQPTKKVHLPIFIRVSGCKHF